MADIVAVDDLGNLSEIHRLVNHKADLIGYFTSLICRGVLLYMLIYKEREALPQVLQGYIVDLESAGISITAFSFLF